MVFKSRSINFNVYRAGLFQASKIRVCPPSTGPRFVQLQYPFMSMLSKTKNLGQNRRMIRATFRAAQPTIKINLQGAKALHQLKITKKSSLLRRKFLSKSQKRFKKIIFR